MDDITFYFTLLRKGFKELFYDAPYYWGIIKLDTNNIITYTEGDIYDVTHNTRDELIKDIERHIKFLKDQGYSSSVYGEYEAIKEEL